MQDNPEPKPADAEAPGFEKSNYMESGRRDGRGQLCPDAVVAARCGGGEAVFETANGAGLTVTALAPKLWRLRFCSDAGYGDGFSYAIAEGALDRRTELEMAEAEGGFRLETSGLVAAVSRDGLRLRFEDSEGNLLSEDERGFHWEEHAEFGGEIVLHSRQIQSGELFYGLGDKSGKPDLRRKRFQLWGSDTYGYGRDTDPLYKSIPFFIGVHHGRAYGIFFDNSFRSFFDFGHEQSRVGSFWAHGGEMDFYFIAGPTVAEVVRGFASLTGTAELPPLWALGYHQCKWSYRTEAETREIAATFRELEIPCDAIYLDIDYMDGFRCFTWNREAFPDPKALADDLAGDGFRLVAMIDPGIKIDRDYRIYREGVERGAFCKRMDGALLNGNVWPGPCHFPDFTDPAVRDWWADLYADYLGDSGLAGVWNDMNEPAVFNEDKTFPRDVRHDYDGHRCSHRRAHNIYGMQMVRATQEGLRRHLGGRRPFVITRSAYAGTWRYSSAWTGDNVSTWEHLRIANVQCQRLSLSGYSFVGSDIGGFLESPDGELFTRWLQLGIFHPLCRTHSSGDHGDQEPWSFGEPYTSAARETIRLRYRLLPYLYTTFWQHTQTGDPILRPLAYIDAHDIEATSREEEFGVGDHLFACPVSKPGADGRWVYLPHGRWFDFWTGRAFEGGDETWVDAPLDKVPLFVREGAVLPLAQPAAHTDALDPAQLELRVYHLHAGEVDSTLYEDAGEGEAHLSGQRNVRRFEVTQIGGLRIKQRCEIGYDGGARTFDIAIVGLEDPLGECLLDGEPVPHRSEGATAFFDGVPATFHELLVHTKHA